MIEVQGLTKHYGDYVAVQDVTFTVPKGAIVGFLGPNGAGKTTTMRVIAGSLGASKGKATVGGFDVAEHPAKVQAMLGYAPETPPVYGNMTVKDYLGFAATLKGVDDVPAATRRALDAVGLTSVAGRVIDNLSKGYRQRVGLAQALVHDPKVLILDEPTSGLDPAQRVEVRNLIQSLAAGDRTIILSTHVLGEVEPICQRVIIINKGRIVAQDDIRTLAERGGNVVRLQVARPEGAIAAIRAVPGVVSVDTEEGYVVARSPDDLRERIAAAAVPFGLLEFMGRARLEDVYLALTREEKKA
jgi:ABC-2 type transport system ATP-binding protein